MHVIILLRILVQVYYLELQKIVSNHEWKQKEDMLTKHQLED